MKRAERIAQAKRDAKMRKFRAQRQREQCSVHESIKSTSETIGARTDDVSALSDDDSDDDALYW